jgi:hypothetical protein
MSRFSISSVAGCCAVLTVLASGAACRRDELPPPQPVAPATAMSFEESKVRVFELVQALARGLRPESGTQAGEYSQVGCVEHPNSMGSVYTGPPFAVRYNAYLKYTPKTAAEITRRLQSLAATGWDIAPAGNPNDPRVDPDPSATSPDGTWVRVDIPSPKTIAEAATRPADEPANWHDGIAIRAGGPCVE